MLHVFEIFTSLQGESTYQGLLCTFIRFTGCNLRCTWCDTKETWEDPGTPMTVEQVLAEVTRRGTELVEITGGEPLLQKDVSDLISRLCDMGHRVLVETSGSLPISEVDGRAVVVMDVKPPSSGEEKSNNFSNLNYLLPGDEIKFPVADRRDFDYALEVLEKYFSGFDFTSENAYLRRSRGTDMTRSMCDRTLMRTAWEGRVPVSLLFSPVESHLDASELARWLEEARPAGARLQIQLHKYLGVR